VCRTSNFRVLYPIMKMDINARLSDLQAKDVAGLCGGGGAVLPLLNLTSTKKSPISLRKSWPLRPSSPPQQGKVNLLLLLQKKTADRPETD
jgi:hypothetical protein